MEGRKEMFILGRLITPKVFKGITYEYQVYKVMSRGRSRALTRNPSVVIFELPDIGNPALLYRQLRSYSPTIDKA
jgi:hypothetical protein